MRLAALCLCFAGAAWGQSDVPLRATLLPSQLELHQLQEEREAVSVAVPVTLTAVGAGLLLTAAVFDAATAVQRRPGEVSVGALLLYAAGVLILPSNAMALVARLIERSMLDAHIRGLERALAIRR